MSGLQQLHFVYQPGQDRILFRVSTTDQAEYRLWLTRRLTGPMFNLLLKRLRADEQIVVHGNDTVQKEILAFQHQEAIQNTEFKQKYQGDTIQSLPLGEVPVLVIKAQVKPLDNGGTLLSLKDRQMKGLDLTLESRMLHSVCKLLVDVTEKADWKLGLSIDTGQSTDTAPQSRTIN